VNDCNTCKNHSWTHGHIWHCEIEHPGAELDMETGLVDCDFFEKKELDTK
jgi:hypothetical protein